jgi:hypothetical protein
MVRKPAGRRALGVTSSRSVPPSAGAPARGANPQRPWFRRRRAWALAGFLLLLFAGTVGSATNAPHDPVPGTAATGSSQTIASDAPAPAKTTSVSTTPVEPVPARDDIQEMVDDDSHAEALAAAALWSEDDSTTSPGESPIGWPVGRSMR